MAPALLLCLPAMMTAQAISGPADALLNARVRANRSAFFVYRDQDAGNNHGAPSGFNYSSGSSGTLHIDAGCVDDPNQANGCSVDPNRIDTGRGTVLRVSFDPQSAGNFAQLTFLDPSDWTAGAGGTGYDLTGASNLVFDIRAQGTAMVQVGVDGCTAPSYVTAGGTWTTVSVPLASMTNCTGASSGFRAVHVLFSVATDGDHSPNGATVLLDNIRFDPVPSTQANVNGFPVSTQTFGIVPSQTGPIAEDQSARNVATTYESALTLLALIEHGSEQDLASAREIADAFDYALHHENHADPLPVGAGSAGLHNAYSSGDLSFVDNQPGGALAGDVRLAGFMATAACPSTGYCVLLDGATGGNNAYAILALLSAYQRFQNPAYLADATQVGVWIVSQLTDGSGSGFGGYFNGYPDTGSASKTLNTAKSVENNAAIFAAFSLLATAYEQAGDTGSASQWRSYANFGGDFVMQMFESGAGRFYTGTVPAGTSPGAGICPSGIVRGNDVVNACDFLDADATPVLALATSPRYSHQIDWTRPVQFIKAVFGKTITIAGRPFQGFSLVPVPTGTGADGIAWEFTGQTVSAMNWLDSSLGTTVFQGDASYYLGQIVTAQLTAPFGDTQGVVASTLQNGEQLSPLQQCLATPFQCIPERVGLAATTWAITAEAGNNPLTSTASTFVNYLYTDVLQRQADPGGLAAWTNQLISRQQTRASVATDFFLSPEAQNGANWVTKGYLGILGRSPDPGGWAFWVQQVRAGLTELQLVSALFDSAEGQGIYGGLDNGGFVNAAYEHVLNRAPDPDGYNLWTSQLNSGSLTREQVILALLSSDEFTRDITNIATVNDLYLALLHRSGDSGGIASWTGQLQNGVQLETIVAGFLASDEFRSHLN